MMIIGIILMIIGIIGAFMGYENALEIQLLGLGWMIFDQVIEIKLTLYRLIIDANKP